MNRKITYITCLIFIVASTGLMAQTHKLGIDGYPAQREHKSVIVTESNSDSDHSSDGSASLPPNSLRLERHFYPVTNLYMPESVTSGEIFRFSARVSNKGDNDVSNAYLKVQILATPGGTIMWQDSMAVDPIASATDSVLVTFPETVTFSPATLLPGQYTIRYTVYQPGITDFTPQDNTRQSTFHITAANDIWQTGLLRTYSRPCFDSECVTTEPWGWGSFFFVPEETVENFRLVDAEVAVTGEVNAASLNDKALDFFLLEILNNDFFAQGTAPDDGTNTYVGFGTIDISSANNRVSTPIPLGDLNEEEFYVEKGAYYFGFLSMPEGVRMGYDNQFLNYPLSLETGFVVGGSSRLIIDGVFGSTFRDAMPYIKINLLTTTTDNTPLPEHALTLFPNPAGNYTMLDLKLDQLSNITITLADISGKVISFQNFKSVLEMQQTIDTSMLPNGTYLVRVATELGTSTKKLMIAK